MRYVYSIVRFVPEPASGEFVNVGVIVGSDEAREWDVRAANLQRARHLDNPDRRSLAAITDFIESVSTRIDEYWLAVEEEEDGASNLEPPTEDWLDDLHSRMEHVVQVTAPVPVQAESAQEALEFIFGHLVVDRSQERLPYLRRTRAAAALRLAYRVAALTEPEEPFVFEKVRVRSGPHTSQLDFAVANGQVVQLAQAWSFQVPDQKRLVERVRSWGWTMERLMEDGGQLLLPGDRAEHVDGTVDLEVVYVPPRAAQSDSSAYEDAFGVFSEIGAVVSPMDEVDAVAQRAAELLGSTPS